MPMGDIEITHLQLPKISSNNLNFLAIFAIIKKRSSASMEIIQMNCILMTIRVWM